MCCSLVLYLPPWGRVGQFIKVAVSGPGSVDLEICWIYLVLPVCIGPVHSNICPFSRDYT